MPTHTAPFSDDMHEVKEAARAGGRAAEFEAARQYFRLAAKMISARQGLELTQAGVARASGVAHSEISRMERGKSNPTLCTVLAVVHSLGFTLEFVPLKQAFRRRRSVRTP